MAAKTENNPLNGVCHNILYFSSDQYSEDHWALQPPKLTDTHVIALVYAKNSKYAISLNHTDKRGYRSIVRLIKSDDMQSTINRNYTVEEQRGLNLVVELTEFAFQRIVPIVQIFKANDSSQWFGQYAKSILIGTSKEPSFLEAHLIGRGDPNHRYISDVKLDGPAIGTPFHLNTKTTSEPGNDKKVSWREGEMKKVVLRMQEEIKVIEKEYEEQVRVVTEQ